MLREHRTADTLYRHCVDRDLLQKTEEHIHFRYRTPRSIRFCFRCQVREFAPLQPYSSHAALVPASNFFVEVIANYIHLLRVHVRASQNLKKKKWILAFHEKIVFEKRLQAELIEKLRSALISL